MDQLADGCRKDFKFRGSSRYSFDRIRAGIVGISQGYLILAVHVNYSIGPKLDDRRLQQKNVS